MRSRVVAGAGAGVMAVGMFTGCASNTTSSEAQPADVKEAGSFTKAVKLSVTNRLGYDLFLEKQYTSLPAAKSLVSSGQRIYTDADEMPTILLVRPNHDRTYDRFTANSPLPPGSASIEYWSGSSSKGNPGTNDGEKELQPGETFRWTSPTSKRTYEFSRAADTNSLVNLSITVVKS